MSSTPVLSSRFEIKVKPQQPFDLIIKRKQPVAPPTALNIPEDKWAKVLRRSNIHVSKLPTVNPTLIGRDDVLDRLDQSRNGASTRIFSIFAFGVSEKRPGSIPAMHSKRRRTLRIAK